MTPNTEDTQSLKQASPDSDAADSASERRWRVGRKVPINVYDEHGAPVCQCQTVEYAKQIVNAVNHTLRVRGIVLDLERDFADRSVRE